MVDVHRRQTVRNIHEHVNYAAMLEMVLDQAAGSNPGVVLNELARIAQSLIEKVIDSHNAQTEKALEIFQERLKDHYANLLWKKVFGLASYEKLSQEACEITITEYADLLDQIGKRHDDFLGKVTAAYNGVLQQSTEAVQTIFGNQAGSNLSLLLPNLNGD